MKKQLSYISNTAILLAILLLPMKASYTMTFPKIELHTNNYTVRLEQSDSLYFLETQFSGKRSSLHFLQKEEFTDLWDRINKIDSSDAAQTLFGIANSRSLENNSLPPDAGFELTLKKKEQGNNQTYIFTWNKNGGLISDGSLTLPVDRDRVAMIWQQLNSSYLNIIGKEIYWPYNCDSPLHTSWWSLHLKAGEKTFIKCQFDPDWSDGYSKNRSHPLFDNLWQFLVNIRDESKYIATIPPNIELSYGDIDIGPFISLFRNQNLIYIRTISIPYDKSSIPPNGSPYTITFLNTEQLSMIWSSMEKLPMEYIKNPPANAFQAFTDAQSNKWSSFFDYKIDGKSIVNWEQPEKIPAQTLKNSIDNLIYSFQSAQNGCFPVMPKKTLYLTLEKEESPGSVQHVKAEILPDGEKTILGNGQDSSILDRNGTKRLWNRFNLLRLFSNHESPIPFSSETATRGSIYRLYCSSGDHVLIKEAFQRNLNDESISKISNNDFMNQVARINDNYFNNCFDQLWEALSKRIASPVFSVNPDNVTYKHGEWTLEKNGSTINIKKVHTPFQCTMPGFESRRSAPKEICSSKLNSAQFQEFWDALVSIDWVVYDDILPEDEIPAPTDVSVYNPLILQVDGNEVVNKHLAGGLRGKINKPLTDLDSILEKFCK